MNKWQYWHKNSDHLPIGLSVCRFIRSSHAGIVLKRLSILLKLFRCWIATSFDFSNDPVSEQNVSPLLEPQMQDT